MEIVLFVRSLKKTILKPLSQKDGGSTRDWAYMGFFLWADFYGPRSAFWPGCDVDDFVRLAHSGVSPAIPELVVFLPKLGSWASTSGKINFQWFSYMRFLHLSHPPTEESLYCCLRYFLWNLWQASCSCRFETNFALPSLDGFESWHHSDTRKDGGWHVHDIQPQKWQKRCQPRNKNSSRIIGAAIISFPFQMPYGI